MQLCIYAVSFFLFLNNYSFSQTDTIKTYFKNGNYESLIPLYKNIRNGLAIYFFENGKMKEERNYVNGRVDGEVNLYYESGTIKEKFIIQNGKREGAVSFFDSTGKFIKEIFFSEGKLLNEQSQIEITVEDSVFTEANEIAEQKIDTVIVQKDSVPAVKYDILPEPVGGMKTIYNKLVYPELAVKKKIQGVVKIWASIDEYGEVTKTKIIQGLGFGCDDAVEITVYYTKFKPAQIKREPVPSEIELEIEFKLP